MIGWVNPADGDTYVEPVFELLEHLKVLGSGLQIEKCQRFFMTVACSGGKLAHHCTKYFRDSSSEIIGCYGRKPQIEAVFLRRAYVPSGV